MHYWRYAIFRQHLHQHLVCKWNACVKSIVVLSEETFGMCSPSWLARSALLLLLTGPVYLIWYDKTHGYIYILQFRIHVSTCTLTIPIKSNWFDVGLLGGCCYPLFLIIDNFLNIHNLCVRDTGNLRLFVCFLYCHKTWLAFFRDQAVLNCCSQQYPLSFTSESEWLMWLLQTIRPVAQYCSPSADDCQLQQTQF